MKLRNPTIADAILRLAGLAMIIVMATGYGYSIAQFAGGVG